VRAVSGVGNLRTGDCDSGVGGGFVSPARKKKPTQTLTDPRYEGLIARVCGVLGIMPAPDQDTPMHELRFKALSDWCQDMQDKERERDVADDLFGEVDT